MCRNVKTIKKITNIKYTNFYVGYLYDTCQRYYFKAGGWT